MPDAPPEPCEPPQVTPQDPPVPSEFYVGWLLDPNDRAALLTRFPPRYTTVIAHHVTLKFGDRTASPSTETEGRIVGVADDGAGVEALIVAIAGTTDRPDGSTYHVTWSLGPGRRSRDSNDVIRDRGWTALTQPVTVRLQPHRFED